MIELQNESISNTLSSNESENSNKERQKLDFNRKTLKFTNQ